MDHHCLNVNIESKLYHITDHNFIIVKIFRSIDTNLLLLVRIIHNNQYFRVLLERAEEVNEKHTVCSLPKVSIFLSDSLYI